MNFKIEQYTEGTETFYRVIVIWEEPGRVNEARVFTKTILEGIDAMDLADLGNKIKNQLEMY